MKPEKVELEQIPLIVVYKQEGQICVDHPHEKINLFELYGFLKVYVKDLEMKLLDDWETEENED